MGQYKKALEIYEQAISLDPGDSGPWLGKGNVNFDLGQYQAAREAYERMLRTLDVLDLNDLIDNFFRALNPQYQLPDYLTFKRDFELHLTHLQEELGHDFPHRFPLPEGF